VGADGTDRVEEKIAKIKGVVNDGSPAANAIGGSLEFHCTSTGGAGGSSKMTLDALGQLFLPEVYADGLTGSYRACSIKSDGQVLVNTSSERYKINIEDIGDISWIYDLKPKSFSYKKKDDEDNYIDESDGYKHFGLIAEDVDIVDKTIVVYDGENRPDALHYDELIAPMLKAIQELSAKVTALENNNQTGENSNEQEEQSADSGDNGGDASGESSGQDSNGTEGDSDNSASTSDDGQKNN
jgi:hypothetical protein